MKTKSIKSVFALALSRWLSGLTILFAIFTMVACGRYEEGPIISFQSIDSRISRTWKVEGFYRNDENITQDWADNYNWTFHISCPDGCSNGITKSLGINMVKVPDWIIPDSAIAFYNIATYRFEDNFCQIIFRFDYYASITDYNISDTVCNECGMYPFVSGKSVFFKINKLTKEKLWISTNDGLNNSYLIKLIPE